MGAQVCTITVIDDDPRVLESLLDLLASAGYSAEGYDSAEQFLTAGALARTSCIITDVEMGQISGLGLLQHLKQENSAIPVIIITGKPSRSESFYLQNGAVGFFKKPVDGEALVELVASVCK